MVEASGLQATDPSGPKRPAIAGPERPAPVFPCLPQVPSRPDERPQVGSNRKPFPKFPKSVRGNPDPLELTATSDVANIITPPLPLTPGTRLGPYEVVSTLGSGGMGEVYRATDTRLKRQVAIKVLPASVAGDRERLARFQREAEILAALNHPNIAAIYGLEETGEATALVMEIVEGPTLADRITESDGRGLPLDESLAVVRQIADALEAAHDQGIIHRDLKPANVKVRDDGTVKVLDFGLAKAMEPASAQSASAGQAVSQSPTITSPAMTQAGLILGTAAYMSPEQAKGRPTDKRSDVWAFGCVLYEMLTGRRAFDGDDVSDTLAAVLRAEPDWSALPRETPHEIRLLLKRCLEKDRRARISDMGTTRFLTTETIAPGHTMDPLTGVVVRPHRWQNLAWAGAGLVCGLAIAGLAAWWRMASESPAGPAPVVRFAITPAAGEALTVQGNDRDLAISPDGMRIVYRGGDPARIFTRAIQDLDPVSLDGTTEGRAPFFSPDGRWIGFFLRTGNDVELRKVALAGGAPVTIARATGLPRGASWGDDDVIVFATSDSATGLMSVPASGGDVTVLTKPEPETEHVSPSVLPEGRAVLFGITPLTRQPWSVGDRENIRIAVLDRTTGQHRILVDGAQPEYASSGHLLYAAGGSIWGIRFDPRRLAVSGTGIPVVERVTTLPVGAAEFAISRNGTLLLAHGTQPGLSLGALVWVDRDGGEQPIKLPARHYAYPRISPDGTRVAVDIRDQDNDIWVWDIARDTLTRLTSDKGFDVSPLWMPDGRRLVFSSSRGGTERLYWQPADGTGSVEPVTKEPFEAQATSVSADGRRIFFSDGGGNVRRALGLITLDNPPKTERIMPSDFSTVNGMVSPDDRWIAYESTETSLPEVYVRPFPNVDGGRWQVSTNGGSDPAWSRDGRELFYLDADGYLSVVPVRTSRGTFVAGSPTRISKNPYVSRLAGRTFDVSPDGRRFLMIKNAEAADGGASESPPLVVVMNWFDELTRRVEDQ